MFTLGYSFRPWTEAEGDRRRAVDPQLHPRHRPRVRRRGHDPLRPPRRRAPTGRPTTRAGRSTWSARDTRRAACSSPAASCSCAPATTATTRATRRSSRAASASAATIVHPQHWPEDLDYAGKRVVVIGSGATAVTLVPAMAERRRPRDDAAALAELRRVAARHRSARRRCCAACCPRRRPTRSCAGRTSCSPAAFFQLCRRWPTLMKALIRKGVDEAAAGRLRRRHALHAALQPVGPAPLPRARRRPVRGDQRRQAPRSSPTRSRPSPRTGLQLRVRRGARGRPHRHRDRPEPADARRDRGSPSTARDGRAVTRPSATRA